MLYASSRLSLLKGLGSSLFADSIFATSKADLTPEAYAAHLRHVSAPNPLSSREQELADLHAAENSAVSYQGSQARQAHVGAGFRWTQEAEEAVMELTRRQEDFLLILVGFLFPCIVFVDNFLKTIDQQTESLIVHSASQIQVSALGSYFPSTEPAYAILSWSPFLSTISREISKVFNFPTSLTFLPQCIL